MSLSDTNGSRESGKPQKWLLAPLLCQETEFHENIFFTEGELKSKILTPQMWLFAPLLCQETEFRENIFFHRGRIKVQDSYPSEVAACPPPLPGNGVS